jgi:hypothetical protein
MDSALFLFSMSMSFRKKAGGGQTLAAVLGLFNCALKNRPDDGCLAYGAIFLPGIRPGNKKYNVLRAEIISRIS